MEKVNKLIESFLTGIEDTISTEELGVKIYLVCSAVDLTFDKTRRKFIQLYFGNIIPFNQPFKEFKKEIFSS